MQRVGEPEKSIIQAEHVAKNGRSKTGSLSLVMSHCVFGVGFSLVCYVYSSRLVCFEPHDLLVVCTRDPLLGQCVYVLF